MDRTTHTHDEEKEKVIRTPQKRARRVEPGERKAAPGIPPELLELRAQVRRALKQLEAAIKKYRGFAEP